MRTTQTVNSGWINTQPIRKHKSSSFSAQAVYFGKKLNPQNNSSKMQNNTIQYKELSQEQKLQLDTFIHFQQTEKSPFARMLNTHLLTPHLEAFVNQPFQENIGELRRSYNIKIKRFRDRACEKSIVDLELPLPSLTPAEEVYSRIIHGKAPIPLQLTPYLLTLNQSLRNNHAFIFAHALNSVHSLTDTDDKLVLNKRDFLGVTAFHTAVMTHHLKAAVELLKKGADPFIPDSEGQTALDLLAENGKTEVLNKLLHNTSPIMKQSQGKAIEDLLLKAKYNESYIQALTEVYKTFSVGAKEKRLLELIDHKFDVNITQEDRILNILAVIQAGADVNQQYAGCRPLNWAVKQGNHRLVKALIQAGAGVNLDDGWKGTPLSTAIVKDCAMVNILLRAGAYPSTICVNGDIPLVMASRANSKMTEMMIKAGADPRLLHFVSAEY